MTVLKIKHFCILLNLIVYIYCFLEIYREDENFQGGKIMARILFVDDNLDLVYVVTKIFKRAGHEVVHASDGEEGLRMIEEDRPDLVLLDVMMPRIDGWEVCKRIKGDEETRDIPVVMVTVKIDLDDKEKSRELGADAHIDKPFSYKDLLETVESFLIEANT
jgi:CheY-like chemotaxis protein